MTAPELPDADLDRLAREARRAYLVASHCLGVPYGQDGAWAAASRAVLLAAQDPAAVERAARALFARRVGLRPSWDSLPEQIKDGYRGEARAALAAAWGTS
jgi:hypothetical protein